MSDKCTRVSEDDSILGYTIDLDDICIWPTKDKKKPLVIDSDMESENGTHGAEKCSVAATWVDWRNISWKLGDSTGLSGVTIEHNSLQKKLGNSN